MAIIFNTEEYRAAHNQREPRGKSAWSFELRAKDGDVKKALTPPGFKFYEEAKEEAREMLQDIGVFDAELVVCP